MDNPKTEVIKNIKDAQNVLVTVSQNPSVDQLAAAIGMTIVLNKIGKHGTAVFSGGVPSTIEFLKPEDTLEKNTDSLRDFIISLDKSKADKLRYKVEDQHVKIFITPYRTTIGQDDLVFSHGDFNVDVVLALGVHEQSQLDQAITAHGRILHDAKIISINVDKPGELGGINLNEQGVSSLSEVMAQISVALKADVLDSQVATAFLTGIVAETERFSNEKTKPETMTISAKLMAAGANQQLVATQLEIKPEPIIVPESEASSSVDNSPNSDDDPGTIESADSVKRSDGSLEIKHETPEPQSEETNNDDDKPEEKPNEQSEEEQHPHAIHVDDDGNFKSSPHDELPVIKKSTHLRLDDSVSEPSEDDKPRRQPMILERPATMGTLTASGKDNENEGSSDPLSLPPVKGQMLSHEKPEEADKPEDATPQFTPPSTMAEQVPESSNEDDPEVFEPYTDQTLESLEKSVDSPHQSTAPESPQPESPKNEPVDIDQLQSEVDKALQAAGDQPPLEPIEALNANPVDLDLGHDAADSPEVPDQTDKEDYFDVTKLDIESGLPANNGMLPEQPKPKFPPDPQPNTTTDASSPASPPPPVPPPMPMMPPSQYDADDHQSLPPVPPL